MTELTEYIENETSGLFDMNEHNVYELNQHSVNKEDELTEVLDNAATYLIKDNPDIFFELDD